MTGGNLEILTFPSESELSARSSWRWECDFRQRSRWGVKTIGPQDCLVTPRRGRNMSAQGKAQRRGRVASPWVNRPPKFNALKGQNRRGTWSKSRVGDHNCKTLPKGVHTHRVWLGPPGCVALSGLRGCRGPFPQGGASRLRRGALPWAIM